MQILNDDTFILYAIKHYNNSSCSGMKEFYDDLKRIKYIKRLLRRYKKSQNISERLVLNHLILLHNVFNDHLVPLLFFKIEKDHWSQLKTFLVFLHYLPEGIELSKDINETDVPLDPIIINKLRKI